VPRAHPRTGIPYASIGLSVGAYWAGVIGERRADAICPYLSLNPQPVAGYNKSTALCFPHIQCVALSHPEDLLVTIPDDDRILTSLNSAHDLLRAGLNGRISRRGLIARARDLGLAAGVTTILLNATGLSARAADPLVTDGKKTKPAGKEVKDGQITVGVVGSIDTLNPYTTNLYAQGFDVLSGVMDGLVGYDSRQRLKPILAEGYTISDDGLT
jgi:hypothetical protein